MSSRGSKALKLFFRTEEGAGLESSISQSVFRTLLARSPGVVLGYSLLGPIQDLQRDAALESALLMNTQVTNVFYVVKYM